jgi:hypothetical protein
MKTILILCTVLISFISSAKLRQKGAGQGNPDLIRAFLTQVVDIKKDTKGGVYPSCVKILCEGNDNLSIRRQFTSFIYELEARNKTINADDIKSEFNNFEDKVNIPSEKGIVCGTYMKSIIKADPVLFRETDKTYEIIRAILGKIVEKKKEKNFVTNAVTYNRDSKLVDANKVLKVLNGNDIQ